MLNAGRKYLGLNDLSGKVFLTSGLGGMSGAQAKAATICGCVGIVAEVWSSWIKMCVLPSVKHGRSYHPGQLRGVEETLRSRLGLGNDGRCGPTSGTRQDGPTEQRSM